VTEIPSGEIREAISNGREKTARSALVSVFKARELSPESDDRTLPRRGLMIDRRRANGPLLSAIKPESKITGPSLPSALMVSLGEATPEEIPKRKTPPREREREPQFRVREREFPSEQSWERNKGWIGDEEP